MRSLMLLDLEESFTDPGRVSGRGKCGCVELIETLAVEMVFQHFQSKSELQDLGVYVECEQGPAV